MFRLTALVLSVIGLTMSASAGMIVRDWQFDTPGDNEGWTASAFQINNLYVGPAVSGTETVLTCENLQNQADPKIYSPNETISLPAGATSWESLVLRIRHIGADGVTPMDFDNTGTIGLYGAGGIPTIGAIPTASNPAATPPVSVAAQADKWLLITWDISAYSGDINAQSRMDPIAGYASGPDILGNFEIDYITLTAVPEPGCLGLLALGALAVGRRRR